jgi:Domain of unknown function (DUF4389)
MSADAWVITTPMADHPVRLAVDDDLRRSRLTVFFRLLLSIPHLIWVVLWTILAFFAVVIGWFVALVTGRLPTGLHGFLSRYVRYTTHLGAYLTLVADPYPPFSGDQTYPIDVTLPDPVAQARWRTFFRLILAIPQLVIQSVLLGGTNFAFRGAVNKRSTSFSGGGGLLTAAAFLGWFSSLATGRMPRGLRDAGAYALGYRAQGLAYVLLLTETYPNSDPTAMLATVERPPVHPVHLVGEADDLRRSRVTVFFRLVLAIPHLVWLGLWGILAWLAAIVQWFITLFTGTPAAGIHGFLSRYVRYAFHVYAFLLLTANPFPGFAGEYGHYPIELELPPPARQNRWTTGFRIVLVVPALLVNAALLSTAVAAAVLMWFTALVRGSAPWGLRNLSAYAIRYSAQANAYFLFVTGAYPNASPLEGGEAQQLAFDLPA